MTTQAPRAELDPETKKYVATCPKCAYKVVRSKRESAEHNLALHLNYEMCRP